MGKALAGLYRQGQNPRFTPGDTDGAAAVSLGVLPPEVCTMIGALHLPWRFWPLELGPKEMA